jgi:uncharacterized membrane protein
MSPDALPHRLALATHLGLAIATALTLRGLDLDPILRITIVVAALLPLALTLPGLVARRRRQLQWLALALVLYAGLGAVEVIAGRHPANVAWLLSALLELALVLRLTRAPPLPTPRATGES